MLAEIERGICSTDTDNSLMETTETCDQENHVGDDDDDAAEMDIDVKPDINRLIGEGGEDPPPEDDSLNAPVSPSFFIDRNTLVPKVEPVEEEEIKETSSPPASPPLPRKIASVGGGDSTTDNNHLPSSSPPEETCDFKQQFDAILSEIAIPDEVFSQALDLMEKCRQIFSIKFPACKLYMFRHWYLKLWNKGMNDLLFYVDFDGTLDGSHLQEECYDKPFKLQPNEIENLLNSKIAQGVLPHVVKANKRGSQFLHQPSGLKFSIVADSLFKTEAQTCRLVNFLLDSDPRARPFFTLIFYWAKACKVEVSKPSCKFRSEAHAFAPKPAALEWMILLFLTHKKVIPSPREVLNRSHQKLFILEKTDIGFSNAKWVNPFSFGESETPPENSNEFFMHLVELARDFFNFYSELRTGSWILNTRDGEVISKDDFLNKKPYVDWKTKLKPVEIANIKAAGAEFKLTKGESHLNESGILMLHPLYCQWCLLFESGRFQEVTGLKMLSTIENINQSLNREVVQSQENSFVTMFRRNLTRIVNQFPFVQKRAGGIGRQNVQKKKLCRHPSKKRYREKYKLKRIMAKIAMKNIPVD
ncbi:unnamed protein product [Orchesella dallaii]|uniref:Uncharacterized protein n=1 Tax=Orchesella dallaii TaxID=48710 RepID=A0ABP1R689_9HEXA